MEENFGGNPSGEKRDEVNSPAHSVSHPAPNPEPISKPVHHSNHEVTHSSVPSHNSHSSNNAKEAITEKMRENPWILSTFVLGLITLVLMTGSFGVTGNAISDDVAGDMLVTYLNAQTGGGVEYESSDDLGNIYEVMVSYKGDNIPVYVTKDGGYFIQSIVPLSDDYDAPSIPGTPNNDEPVDVSIDDDAIKGDPNAPVTIIEFSDYECPFCGRHYEQTLPQIISEYVDAGKVKIVFRDFPLGFHQKAQKAGEAAECAGKLGGDEMYWEMHDKLFDNQQALDVDDLKKYAKELGLNTKDFNACLDSDEFADEIKSDLADGQAAGVSGTPASFVNGRLVSGAVPFSEFKKIIDEELAKVSA